MGTQVIVGWHDVGLRSEFGGQQVDLGAAVSSQQLRQHRLKNDERTKAIEHLIGSGTITKRGTKLALAGQPNNG
jgi:hypothetical protein